MKQQFNHLLSSCVKYIESSQNRLGGEEECKIHILEQYNNIKNEEKLELFEIMYQSFDHDPRLYTLIMSALYLATNDFKCLLEITKFLTDNKMDLFDSIIVKSQLLYCLFVNSEAKMEYQTARRSHKSLLDRFEKLLNVEYEYTPVEERDEKLIVIVTQQLLGDLHAPTRIIKEISALLQKELGIRVIIIVALEETNIQLQWENWASPIIKNYIKEYDGNFLIEYDNEKIQGFQMVINSETIEKQKNLVKEICEMKPLFVWSMGDNFLFSDQFRRYTTVVTQRFSTSGPVAESSILLDYFNYKLDDQTENFLKQNNQNFIHTSLILPVRESGIVYTRDEYNIPTDAFVIGIIGNRLDEEITEEFIETLETIIQNDSEEKIFFIFVGLFDNYKQVVANRILGKKSIYCGFQKELLAMVKMTNLFLNPPRKGGATGALYSMYHGVPVVTMGNCDTALIAGEEFICESKKEMIELVHKYVYDNEFYNKQSNRAFNKSRSNIDFKNEMEKLIKNVTTLAK